MLMVAEGEEAFLDHLMSEESVASNYDIWLGEPKSVRERRENFLSKMGFSDFSTSIEPEVGGLQTVAESIDDNLLCERRKSNSEANCSVDYSDCYWLDNGVDVDETKGVEVCLGEMPTICKKRNKAMTWLRSFTQKMKKTESKLGDRAGKMRIERNSKRYVECSAVYAGQELKAHNGIIWAMKFSPDGRFLASGGEDGVVCVWRVTMVEPICKADKCCSDMERKLSFRKDKSNHASILIPERTFHLEEEPVHKFKGHSSDVLDLAWSKSNHLLSSSMDKTVRLWHADSDECLGVFHHSNYVTCVQFNPVDESFFISGSIDGKVRVWGIHRRRVQEWSNVRDIVTAVCYQPNGEGFVVGTLSGNCRFYESSSNELLLKAEMNFRGKKRSSDNKITGIQFLNNDSQRLMITSEDSKIRIVDALEVVRKYKGLAKSGSQMSASFTSSGSHVVSIGEDSRIYIWNYEDPCLQTPSKQAKSTRSCENFFSEGVTVALPWSDPNNNLSCPTSVDREAECFSLGNWFSTDGSSRGSSKTWPEEKLPLWESAEDECGDLFHGCKKEGIQSPTWGLVFVTGSWDGSIRTFHNYGLPLRI